MLIFFECKTLPLIGKELHKVPQPSQFISVNSSNSVDEKRLRSWWFSSRIQ